MRTEHPSSLPPGGSFDLPGVYNALREKAWLPALFMTIALSCAIAYLGGTAPTFVARCIAQVEGGQRKVVKIEDISAEDPDKLETLKTIESNVTIRPVMERVVEELNISGESLGLSKEKGVYTTGDLAAVLRGKVFASLIRGTRLIAITAENEDADLAAGIANATIAQYRSHLLRLRKAVSSEAHDFLIEEEKGLKAKLEQSEQALQRYKEESHGVSLEDSQNIVVEQLKDLNGKLTEATAERVKWEAIATQVERQRSIAPENLPALAQIAQNTEVISQRKMVSDLEGQIANLEQRYLEKHPTLIQARSQLAEMRAELTRAVDKAADGAIAQSHAAAETENKLAAALRDQEAKALELNRKAIQYNVLARDVESDRALFDTVLTRLKETEVTKGVDHDVIQVIEPAIAPDYPAKPRRKLILAAAAIGGLGLGLCVSLALIACDSSLKTVAETESELGRNVLVAIPQSRRLAGARAMVMATDPSGLTAESFRTLRTALLVSDEPPETIMFTSAVSEEGKSFCSLNCASAFAGMSLRTLLIDADLRMPTIGKVLPGTDRGGGLAEVLLGRIELEEAVTETGQKNLFVLPAGRMRQSPAEVLAATTFLDLLSLARQDFERIVIDTPPVQSVSDALLLAKYVQLTVLVVKAGKVPRRAVQNAVQRLAEAGPLSTIKIILNGVPANGRHHYHYGAGKYGEAVYTPAREGTLV